MRVLTLLELAANQQVLSFSALQEKLDLNEDSLEEFIIDGKLRNSHSSKCSWNFERTSQNQLLEM